MDKKIIINDHKIGEESTLFVSFRSKLVLERFLDILSLITIKKVVICTEEIQRVKEAVARQLGDRPDIEVVDSVQSGRGDIVINANYIYNETRLIGYLKKGKKRLNRAVIWKMKRKTDIEYADITTLRYELNPISRYFNVKIGIWLAEVLKNTRMTPNHITFLSLLFGIAAAFLIISDSYLLIIPGVIALHIHTTLDWTDGHLARLKKVGSKLGESFDWIVNRVVQALMYIIVPYSLYLKYDNDFYIIIGFLLNLGNFFVLDSRFLRLQIFGKTIPSFYSTVSQEKKKHFWVRMLKQVHLFTEKWDFHIYALSVFALLKRLEIPIVFFVVNYYIRWLFNLYKIFRAEKS